MAQTKKAASSADEQKIKIPNIDQHEECGRSRRFSYSSRPTDSIPSGKSIIDGRSANIEQIEKYGTNWWTAGNEILIFGFDKENIYNNKKD